MPIDKSWLQSIDQIVTFCIAENKRIIGITSPQENSGVSMLSAILAESFALSHIKSLLVDVSNIKDADGANGSANEKDWVPIVNDPSDFIRHDKLGFDRLTSHPNTQNRFIFNNIDQIRHILDDSLGDYGAIIIDMPAILSNIPDGINPVSCAAACDAVYLLSLTGQTTSSALGESKERLDAARAPLQGVILNDRDYVSTGASMAQLLRRMRFIPGMKSMADKVEKAALLR